MRKNLESGIFGSSIRNGVRIKQRAKLAKVMEDKA